MKPFKFQEGGISPNSLVFGTDENPIELQGVDVTAKKLNWLEKRWNDIKWAFRNANWKNRFLDFGLRVVDNISQPVVIRSTWQPFDLNSYTLPK